MSITPAAPNPPPLDESVTKSLTDILIPIKLIPAHQNLTILPFPSPTPSNRFQPLQSHPTNKLLHILLDYFLLLTYLADFHVFYEPVKCLGRDFHFKQIQGRSSISKGQFKGHGAESEHLSENLQSDDSHPATSSDTHHFSHIHFHFHDTLEKNEFLLMHEFFFMVKRSQKVETDWIRRFGEGLYAFLAKAGKSSARVSSAHPDGTKIPLTRLNAYVSANLASFIEKMIRGHIHTLKELCNQWAESVLHDLQPATDQLSPDAPRKSSFPLTRIKPQTLNMLHQINKKQYLYVDDVFVDREDELDMLYQFHERCLDRSAAVFISSTEEATGKTALAQTFAQRQTQRRVFSARCRSETTLPFACFQIIFAEFVSRELHTNEEGFEFSHELDEDARTFVENYNQSLAKQSSKLQNITAQDIRESHLNNFGSLLQSMSIFIQHKYQQQLCFIFDDAHYIDPASMRLIHHIFKFFPRLPVLFMVVFTRTASLSTTATNLYETKKLLKTLSSGIVLDLKIYSFTQSNIIETIQTCLQVGLDEARLFCDMFLSKIGNLTMLGLKTIISHGFDLGFIHFENNCWKVRADQWNEWSRHTLMGGGNAKALNSSTSAEFVHRQITNSMLQHMSSQCNLLLQYLSCIAPTHSIRIKLRQLLLLSEMKCAEDVLLGLAAAFQEGIIDSRSLEFTENRIYQGVLRRTDPIFRSSLHMKLAEASLETSIFSVPTVDIHVLHGVNHFCLSLFHNEDLIQCRNLEKWLLPITSAMHVAACLSCPELTSLCGQTAKKLIGPSPFSVEYEQAFTIETYNIAARIQSAQHQLVESCLAHLLDMRCKTSDDRMACWKLRFINFNHQRRFDLTRDLLLDFIQSHPFDLMKLNGSSGDSISLWMDEFWKKFVFAPEQKSPKKTDRHSLELLGCLVEGLQGILDVLHEINDATTLHRNLFLALASIIGKLSLECCENSYTAVGLSMFCVPLCARGRFNDALLTQQQVSAVESSLAEKNARHRDPVRVINVISMLPYGFSERMIQSFLGAHPLHLSCMSQFETLSKAHTKAVKNEHQMLIHRNAVICADTMLLFALFPQKSLALQHQKFLFNLQHERLGQECNLLFHSQRLLETFSGHHKAQYFVRSSEYPVKLRYDVDNEPILRFHHHLYTSLFFFYMDDPIQALKNMNRCSEFKSDVLGTVWTYSFWIWKILIVSECAHKQGTEDFIAQLNTEVDSLKNIATSFKSYFDPILSLMEADLAILNMHPEARYSGYNMFQILRVYQHTMDVYRHDCRVVSCIAAERMALYLQRCRMGLFERAAAVECLERYTLLQIVPKINTVRRRFETVLRESNPSAEILPCIDASVQVSPNDVTTKSRPTPRKKAYSTTWDHSRRRYIVSSGEDFQPILANQISSKKSPTTQIDSTHTRKEQTKTTDKQQEDKLWVSHEEQILKEAQQIQRKKTRKSFWNNTNTESDPVNRSVAERKYPLTPTIMEQVKIQSQGPRSPVQDSNRRDSHEKHLSSPQISELSEEESILKDAMAILQQ